MSTLRNRRPTGVAEYPSARSPSVRTPLSASTHGGLIVGLGDPLVLQRVAGNVAVGAAVAAERPLESTQAALAQRWYRSHSDEYTPRMLRLIQERVHAPVTGRVSPAFVQAVAAWQRRFPGEVELDVDGIAGPAMLPRLFPDGLNELATARGYWTASHAVREEWQELGPVERVGRLVNEVNVALRETLVPQASFRGDDSVQGTARFQPSTWEILFDPRILVSGPKAAGMSGFDLTENVYHEARHAEQVFNMARMLAGSGLDEAGIQRQFRKDGSPGLPDHVVSRAWAYPLQRGTPLWLIAKQMFDFIYGHRGQKRLSALRAQSRKAEAAKLAALERAVTHPSRETSEEAALARIRADLALRRAEKAAPWENDAEETSYLLLEESPAAAYQRDRRPSAYEQR